MNQLINRRVKGVWSLQPASNRVFWIGLSGRTGLVVLLLPFPSRVQSLISNLSILTLPSFPWYTLTTFATFHWTCGVALSCRRTTSLTLAFLQSLIHFCLCKRLRRYSSTLLFSTMSRSGSLRVWLYAISCRGEDLPWKPFQELGRLL